MLSDITFKVASSWKQEYNNYVKQQFTKKQQLNGEK